MSNPVLNNFGRFSKDNQPPTAGELQGMYDQPAYTGPRTGVAYMTLDAVVQRTAAMLAVVFAAGAVTWVVVPDSAFVPALVIGAVGGGVLGVFMALTGRVNPATALIYAALQGVFLGAVSKAFEQRFPGIVVQAVIGTAAVAGGMLFVYKIGAIRVTPKFTRIVIGATIGVAVLALVNLIAYLFTPGGLGLRDGGVLAIVFSLICIVVASMNLVLDFDFIERGIRQGAPAKLAWYAAFGLTITLVWLYIEILRLIAFSRD